MELKNEIEQELKEWSPYLASLKRQHPFTVPENYFQEMEHNILKLIHGGEVKPIHENVLARHEHPFEVPEGYFENLHSNIISAIKGKANQGDTGRQATLRKRNVSYKVWMAAASVAVVGLLSIWMYNQNSVIRVSTTPPSVDSEDATFSYLLEDASEIDEALVVELLVQERLQLENESKAGQGTGESEQGYDPSLMDVTDIDPELLDEI